MSANTIATLGGLPPVAEAAETCDDISVTDLFDGWPGRYDGILRGRRLTIPDLLGAATLLRRRLVPFIATLLPFLLIVFNGLMIGEGWARLWTQPDTSTESTDQGDLERYLGPAQLMVQTVFAEGRFPNVVTTPTGAILVTWGSDRVWSRCSRDGGLTWEAPVIIDRHGIHGGGTTIDPSNGEILAFVEVAHPPADLRVYRSRDDGRSWERSEVEIAPDSQGNTPSMHMNEHGIALSGDAYAGRLIRPSRFYGEGNRPPSLWPTHYTNAIYSDDGGRTWKTSDPFPENGTGEACIVQLSDGRLYYNSRRHWAPDGKDPRRRWTAFSEDGGQTWTNARICDALPDGPQNTNYGCMGGLVRLPIDGRDVLLYSNCDHATARRNGTVWCSFDGGQTWPVKRVIDAGDFAYSSLSVGLPGTPIDGWVFLHYESHGGKLARFNLSWILEGQTTGDGKVPNWVR